MSFIVLDTILIKCRAYKLSIKRNSKCDFKDTVNYMGYGIQISNYWDVFVGITFKKYFEEGHTGRATAEIKKTMKKVMEDSHKRIAVF